MVQPLQGDSLGFVFTMGAERGEGTHGLPGGGAARVSAPSGCQAALGQQWLPSLRIQPAVCSNNE